ncbi:uncharacterized protein LOC110450488 [Mizuhopecten yessoensis]|uniref:Uncharacterized protein n=1 Tax=Mizuhopecten yessoensis TaxID=6573 RepID=A0A210QNS4_MIZYE|nr:uncharacterized protein LOC110450488 [Mizuhopecten yessoensis]OWF50387.1 hypothetical protein KP79_PYT09460 [Mizuhopecten yessoensis]
MNRQCSDKSLPESNGMTTSSGKVADLTDLTGKTLSTRKPAGTVESGVLIRKTSIRRRMSTETGDGANEVIYGNQTKEYSRLRKEIVSSPAVTKALEGLRERWKMLMFMHEDCLDMIQDRKDRHKQRRKCRERREIFASCIIYTGIFMPITILTLTILLIIF